MKHRKALLIPLCLLTGCTGFTGSETPNETERPNTETSIKESNMNNTANTEKSERPEEETELFTDPKFETGLYLKSTTTADGSLVVKHLDYEGKAKEKKETVWNMAQWWTPFNFKDAPYRFENGKHIYENESRTLSIDSVTGEFEMGLDSWKEYQERFGTSRSSGSQTWSHFLIEQDFAKKVYLSEVSNMTLSFDYRIDSVELFDKENFNKNLHTAQFVMYFIVRNEKLNKFFWFGIPLYDYRGYGDKFSYSIDQGFEGATNTLIYSIGREEFLPNGELPEIGKNYYLNINLLSYIQDAIIFGATTSSINYPLKDWEMKDTCVTYMNFGWELPGSFRIDSHFSNLSLKVK